jgi:hypothetical protein
MNDFYIPNVQSSALAILLAYCKDKLPNHQVDIIDDNVTIRDVSHTQNEQLNMFIDSLNNI